MIGGNEYILASTQIVQSQLPSQTKITFSPTSSEVKVKFKYGTSAWTWHGHSICITKPVMVSETYYVDVCDGGDDKYRFGFNGMEKDNEVKGIGNSLDFGARMYDSRVGRWMSLDPLQVKYPSLTPYNFVANSPIIYVDPDGREIRVYYKVGSNEYYVYKPGIKPVNKDYILSVTHEAIAYNLNTQIGQLVWHSLSESDKVIEIRPTNNVAIENHFQYTGGEKTIDGKEMIGVIHWDFTSPLNIFDDGIYGGTVKGNFSPSTVLFHEGAEAFIALDNLNTSDFNTIEKYKMDTSDIMDYDSQYDTKTERNVIENFEHKYVKEINSYEQNKDPLNANYQPIRFNHKGKKEPLYKGMQKINVNDVYKPEIYKQWRKNEIQKGMKIEDGVK